MNNDAYTCKRPETRPSAPPAKESAEMLERFYDPELLYVECRNCGNPILWEAGKTTELLEAAAVNIESLDENCLIISDGCPTCCPGIREGFPMMVARVAQLKPGDMAELFRPGGNA